MPANVLLIAAILGLIQGFAEFLPISSSAHLILARDLFGWSLGGQDMELVFDTVLHLGTMVAILAYFRQDIIRLTLALFSSAPERKQDRKLAIYIWLATIPAGVAGAVGEKKIEDIFRANVTLILVLLAGVGILMWLADYLGKKDREGGSVTFWDAMLIGVAQATALMPGVSRSGATITTGLVLGFRREDAARFSFLLSTPAMAGAALWSSRTLKKHPIPSGGEAAMLIGFLVSAVVGYLCIAGLLRFLRTRSVGVFTAYRIALAVVVFFALLKR